MSSFSNGIRFSISDLSPPTARSIPTVFQSRSGISLYDAQYSTGVRGPIPQPIIDSVLEALQRFKITCQDFGVSESNIQVLATEATRTAVNSEDYRRQIKEATGWGVEMLTKEMEGRIGAMGVASSFQSVEGLVMDLGGGSTQITWLIGQDGNVQTSPQGSISFPYGAAALMRKLDELSQLPPSATESFAQEMQSNFSTAYHDLTIPPSLLTKAQQEGGLTLYLSGGGFRGWGYLLMSQSKTSSPYPIPIINGFQVPKSEFHSTTQIQRLALSLTNPTSSSTNQSIFRVSPRRAAQVPAVAFLINNLTRAIPNIKDIRFCQGGVREGYLFSSLPAAIRAIDPLVAATTPYAPPSSAEIAELIFSALPAGEPVRVPQPFLSKRLVVALANLMFVHSSHPKESASLTALHAPITGLLASAHGISHSDRALLALMLCGRWEGELAPPHDDLRERLVGLVGREEGWWAGFLGEVAGCVGGVYPAGVVREKRVGFKAEWVGGLGKRGLEEGIRLTMRVGREGDPMVSREWVGEAVHAIEKLGKRKHWIGGREDGFGIRVEVSVDASL